MDIKEGNLLIRDFMEVSHMVYGDWSITVSINNGLYHSDWSWLMPVIDKIRRFDVAIQLISNGTCCIHNFNQGFDYHFSYQFESNFSPVYKAVVEYIKWHNENYK